MQTALEASTQTCAEEEIDRRTALQKKSHDTWNLPLGWSLYIWGGRVVGSFSFAVGVVLTNRLSPDAKRACIVASLILWVHRTVGEFGDLGEGGHKGRVPVGLGLYSSATVVHELNMHEHELVSSGDRDSHGIAA